MTTRRQSIAKPPMEDSYGRLHRNIDVREIKQVVNILHIHLVLRLLSLPVISLIEALMPLLIEISKAAFYTSLTKLNAFTLC